MKKLKKLEDCFLVNLIYINQTFDINFKLNMKCIDFKTSKSGYILSN